MLYNAIITREEEWHHKSKMGINHKRSEGVSLQIAQIGMLRPYQVPHIMLSTLDANAKVSNRSNPCERCANTDSNLRDVLSFTVWGMCK
jgi:hypothetical protein